MRHTLSSVASDVWTVLAHAGGGRTPAEAFEQIFTVFLVLGTAVGVVVILYLLYHTSSYSIGGKKKKKKGDAERPRVGTLPSDTGGGKKLAISFVLSAILVVSLIVWTYGFFTDIERGPEGVNQQVAADAPSAHQDADVLTVEVHGFQWGWRFVYPDGTESNTLRVPNDTAVQLRVTSDDVFHNFGISKYNIKTDAIPGQTTTTWFVPEETGNTTARCYELCGAGHSDMTAQVQVMEQSAFEEWYQNESSGGESGE